MSSLSPPFFGLAQCTLNRTIPYVISPRPHLPASKKNEVTWARFLRLEKSHLGLENISPALSLPWAPLSISHGPWDVRLFTNLFELLYYTYFLTVSHLPKSRCAGFLLKHDITLALDKDHGNNMENERGKVPAFFCGSFIRCQNRVPRSQDVMVPSALHSLCKCTPDS